MDEDLDSIINFLNDKQFQQSTPLPISVQPSVSKQISEAHIEVIPTQHAAEYQDPISTAKGIINSQQQQVVVEDQATQNAVSNNISQVSQQLQNGSNVSQSYSSIDNAKKNQFIIRKTQNKRIMSQIRSNGPRPPKQGSVSKKRLPDITRHSELSITDYGKLMRQQIPSTHTNQQYVTQQNLGQIKNMNNSKLFLKQNSEKFSEMKENFSLLENHQQSPDQQKQQQMLQVDQLQQAPQQDLIVSKQKKKALVFRPYEDPMSIKPYQPPDRGYYFKFISCDVKIIRYTLEDNGFREAPTKDTKDCSAFWSCSALKPQFYQSLTKYQKVNHFPSSFHITRKDLMYKQVSKMREMHGQKHFNFIPKTFLLPNEYTYLEAEMDRDKEKIWIAKPSASSQGKGIIVTKLLTDIPNKGNPYIVSEYIGNPLLFDGYKFDLRIYVAITCMNPLKLYIYEEGLTRFATSKYNNSNIGNNKQSKYTHLTNYSLNKNNPNFVANTDSSADNVGSKWSITALRKALKEAGIDDAAIWKKIDDIIIKTILSAESIMFQSVDQYVPFRNNCFELLGFDILIDNNLDPWLLEVNLSPSLACDSPLDQKIKGNVIAELFTLAGIVPLDQRQGVTDGGIYGKKQTGFYGAYQQNDLEKVAVKRDSFSATGSKRRDNSKIQHSSEVNSNNGYGVAKQGSLNAKQERQLIKETEHEFRRRGNFKRVFPSLDYQYYKQFFVEERYLNHLIDQKLMSKRRLTNAVTSAVQVKQRIDHINHHNPGKTSLIQQPVIKKMIPPLSNTRKPNHEAKQMNQDLEQVVKQ